MLSMNVHQASAMATNMLACTNSTTLVSPMMSYLSIYSGSPPTVDATFVWKPATYVTSRLYQKTDVVYKAVVQASTGLVVGIDLNAPITTVPATLSGAAAWFAIHNGVAGQPVLIGTCSSNATTTDSMLLNTTNLVAGTNFNIMDLTIRFIGNGS